MSERSIGAHTRGPAAGGHPLAGRPGERHHRADDRWAPVSSAPGVDVAERSEAGK